MSSRRRSKKSTTKVTSVKSTNKKAASRVDLQRSFLQFFHHDLQTALREPSPSFTLSQPFLLVATADFALISHLKDKFGRQTITNYPSVLNISLYTTPDYLEHISDVLIHRLQEFINEHRLESRLEISPHKCCVRSYLPCILRLILDGELFADFLITTKPYRTELIDRDLSEQIGYSVRKLDDIV